MKVLLMHRDKDFELYRPASENRYARRQDVDRDALLRAVLWNAPALTQDLELNTLLRAMAGADEFVFEVAQQALLSGLRNDVDTIFYRQAILRDCLKNAVVVRGLYDLMTAVAEETRRQWWSLSGSYPSSMLYGSRDLMETFLHVLRKLRSAAGENDSNFESEGFRSLFAMLKKELSEQYLTTIRSHLEELKFHKGALLSAELGNSNEGTHYMLRKAHAKDQTWLDRLLGRGAVSYSFRLDPRDEAGARILSDMRNRGISRVALALTQSSDHVLSFFKTLRTELAFYVGCLNLHSELVSHGMPIAFPTPMPAGQRCHEFSGLYDVNLCLTMNRGVVGNTLHAEHQNLVIITGANQGGKTTFLRSIGLAQLMMQCGLFVGADGFKAEICPALLTHHKREEDAAMKSGKFDEELARMSDIADRIVPNSVVLFNESFAATNEREGSEIATQIVRALLEKGMKVFYVTHLYEFARGFFNEKDKSAIFLRAEREADGTRTFKLAEGEPLQTGYGQDLYKKVFAVEEQTVAAGPTMSS
jgi:DNA mismatch repair ATPase MutS